MPPRERVHFRKSAPIGALFPAMTPHERVHFLTLTPDAQAAAIRRLAAAGYGDHAIAAITGWHVDAVRRVLAEPEGCGV